MLEINGKTQLVGIIGWPVSHSFSPVMHNAAFADLGLNWKYVPLPVRLEDVATAVSALPTLGFKGVNITVPHKQAVMPFLDRIAPGARAIGAVNTVVVQQNGKLVGHNTDWSGFLADLAQLNQPISGRSCLVLGAGGSARSIAYALAQAGGQVTVFARRIEQAQQLVTDLQAHLSDAALKSQDLAELETIFTPPPRHPITPLFPAPSHHQHNPPRHDPPSKPLPLARKAALSQRCICL